MADPWFWPQVAASDEALRLLARTLRQGGVVALPTESGPVLAASGLHAGAVARLGGGAGRPIELVVAGRAEARDWLPGLGALGRRLADRVWPGPVALVSGDGVDRGLAGRLPAAARQALEGPDGLTLRRPRHEALARVRQRLGGPLVCAGLDPAGAADLVVEDDLPAAEAVTALHVSGERWRVLRPGALSEGEVRERLARRIVFVCTGNTCRSPMAEAICKQLLADRLGCAAAELPARGWVVTSAGLGATPGMPAAREAVEVAGALGADLGGHRSRALTEEMAAQADHLLGMTEGHVRALRQALPAHPTGPRLLSPTGDDVDDPIGRPLAAYEACARQMRGPIEALIASLAG